MNLQQIDSLVDYLSSKKAQRDIEALHNNMDELIAEIEDDNPDLDALTYCAEQNNFEMVKYLIESQHTQSMNNGVRWIALGAAIQNRNEKIATYLFHSLKDANHIDFLSPEELDILYKMTGINIDEHFKNK